MWIMDSYKNDNLLHLQSQHGIIHAMQYLTRKQYVNIKKMSRQAIHNKIKRGTLDLVRRTIKKEEWLIPVDDTELEGVNIESI